MPHTLSLEEREGRRQMSELDRGYAYLKRFRTLSRAFATGDFRMMSTPKAAASNETNSTGPWQKVPLYSKLDALNTTIAKLYGSSGEDAAVEKMSLNLKPVVYQAQKTLAVIDPTPNSFSFLVHST